MPLKIISALPVLRITESWAARAPLVYPLAWFSQRLLGNIDGLFRLVWSRTLHVRYGTNTRISSVACESLHPVYFGVGTYGTVSKMEQGTGVAPVTPAWKAGVLLLN